MNRICSCRNVLLSLCSDVIEVAILLYDQHNEKLRLVSLCLSPEAVHRATASCNSAEAPNNAISGSSEYCKKIAYSEFT